MFFIHPMGFSTHPLIRKKYIYNEGSSEITTQNQITTDKKYYIMCVSSALVAAAAPPVRLMNENE